MSKSFFQRIVTPEGDALVHVNRRGCKGRWTKQDAEALAELVEAVQRMHRTADKGADVAEAEP